MVIEPENMSVKLLGTGERKTSYRCEFCRKNWTNGLTSHKGFICCKECMKANIEVKNESEAQNGKGNFRAGKEVYQGSD